MEKIKKFLYPNKGVLGIFLLWANLFVLNIVITLATSPVLVFSSQQAVFFSISVLINLAILYFLSCLSAWIYEKLGKEEGKKRRR